MAATSPDATDAPTDTERNERLASLLLEVARAIDPDVARVLPLRSASRRQRSPRSEKAWRNAWLSPCRRSLIDSAIALRIAGPMTG